MSQTTIKTKPVSRTSEIAASDYTVEGMLDYTKNVMRNQLPSPIDGLKRVVRRILYTIRDTKKFISGSKLISRTIEYHQHGDSSIYGAALLIAQSFQQEFPLLAISGNCGTYLGNNGAKSRYVDFALTDFTRDVFINGIDFRTFHLVQDDDLKLMEPDYFIPKLPTALLMGNLTIGVGAKSVTLPYRFDLVCDAVMALSEFSQNNWIYAPWPNAEAYKYFEPHFPINNRIRNMQQLKKAYRKGNYTHRVVMDGEYYVYPNMININTLPMGVSVNAVSDTILKTMRQRNSSLDQMLVDFPQKNASTANELDWHFRLKKSVDPFKAIKILQKIMKITGYMTPTNKYIFDNLVVTMNPPEVVRAWYNERYRSILNRTKYRQMRIATQLDELNIHLIAADHAKTVTKIAMDNSKDEARKILIKMFKLTYSQVKIFNRIPLEVLYRSSKPELEAKRAKLLEEAKNIRDGIGRTHEQIYTETEQLRRKYGKQIRKPTKMIGYVKIGKNKIIQFNSVTEMTDILTKYNKEKKLYATMYPSFAKEHHLSRHPNFENDLSIVEGSILPKIVMGEYIIWKIHDIKYTVFRKKKDIGLIRGFVEDKIGYEIYYLRSSNVILVTRTGQLIRTTVDDIPTFKKSGNRGNEIIYAFDDDGKFPKYLISMNTLQPNHITIHNIDKNTVELGMVAIGETYHLGILNHQYKEILVPIHPECVRGMKIRFLHLINFSGFTGTTSTINLNRIRFKRREVVKNTNAGLATVNISII